MLPFCGRHKIGQVWFCILFRDWSNCPNISYYYYYFTFMQATYNCIPETNHVSRVEDVAAILQLQFMVKVLLLISSSSLFTIIFKQCLIFHLTDGYIDVNSFLLLEGYRNIVTKMNTDSKAHGPADKTSAFEERHHQTHGPVGAAATGEGSSQGIWPC